jgi:hypothetical protein
MGDLAVYVLLPGQPHHIVVDAHLWWWWFGLFVALLTDDEAGVAFVFPPVEQGLALDGADGAVGGIHDEVVAIIIPDDDDVVMFHGITGFERLEGTLVPGLDEGHGRTEVRPARTFDTDPESAATQCLALKLGRQLLGAAG